MGFAQRLEGHNEMKTGQYWAFGYYFKTLDSNQNHQRREYLDWYGFVAQWSVVAIFALFQLSFFLRWLVKSGLSYEAPKSPSFNKTKAGKLGWLRNLHSTLYKMSWWMAKDAIPGWDWGSRGEWAGATAWSTWLLYLCIANTGNDYLHFTKRFGQIGASQLPIHYLLAMRAPYSPIQWLTRCSHEQLKSAHHILGRIVFALFVLHAAFYLNFFILTGYIAKRIKDWDVITGIICIFLFSTISTTSLAFVRRRNYRVFYISHIAIANFIILPLWLHVSHIRVYVYQVVAVEALHLVFRALRVKVFDGAIRLLPGTNLVQIRIPLPANSSALKWKPGQHVYLSRPHGKPTTPSLYRQWLMTNKSNPFSIASFPSKDKELLLIARTLNGNTKYLAELARSLAQGGSSVPMLPIVLEGPYGASTRLPDLADYDKILLVAGGVGATFIMPIYQSIQELHDPMPTGTQIRCIWAVQKAAETQWAFEASEEKQKDAAEANGEGNGLRYSPSVVEVYVTRPSGPNLQADRSAFSVFVVDPDGDDQEGEEFEMAENEQLLSMEEQMEKPHQGMVVKSSRPNMEQIVDEVMSKSMKTAVLCCGPKRLTEDLKQKVEVWVSRGHDVFWYDETFGW